MSFGTVPSSGKVTRGGTPELSFDWFTELVYRFSQGKLGVGQVGRGGKDFVRILYRRTDHLLNRPRPRPRTECETYSAASQARWRAVDTPARGYTLYST